MGRHTEGGDHGVTARGEGKHAQVQRRGLLQVRHGFFNGFTLSGGSGFRVQRDVAAFFGGCEDSREFRREPPAQAFNVDCGSGVQDRLLSPANGRGS